MVQSVSGERAGGECEVFLRANGGHPAHFLRINIHGFNVFQSFVP